eukprot:TRINITY_DN357_c0_g2_i1.p1 TRINITY_DN357_c0_g2~~TRINITY_DN357_c0_g2_i1.p1  ORF type:complete len:414 (-),score=134.69 TRINITY_DN357_c0_g2_i1:130-1371(-)
MNKAVTCVVLAVIALSVFAPAPVHSSPHVRRFGSMYERAKSEIKRSFQQVFPDGAAMYPEYLDEVVVPAVAKKAEELSKLAPEPKPEFTFECPVFKPHPYPDNIKDLHPYDVKVAMAMGDSITAAYLAERGLWPLQPILEYRGESWSIGGDKDRNTVGNFLKRFDPGLYGESTGSHPMSPPDPATDHLNAAIGGSKAENMTSQAIYIVDQLKAAQDAGSIDIAKDWKLLTIMIGPNDGCIACQKNPRNLPPAYESNLRAALEILRQIPRLFINLVAPLDPIQLYEVSKDNAYCANLHKLECPCSATSDKAQRDYASQVMKEDQQIVFKLADEYAAKGFTDWAVVAQPFLTESVIPDLSYVSPLDCFHPNGKSHVDLAVGLWNNMIQKKADKSNKWFPGELPKCPDENTRLWID